MKISIIAWTCKGWFERYCKQSIVGYNGFHIPTYFRTKEDIKKWMGTEILEGEHKPIKIKVTMETVTKNTKPKDMVFGKLNGKEVR